MIELMPEEKLPIMDLERLIFKHEGDPQRPTVVFFGGIHGNEPSGVYALQQLKEYCSRQHINTNGNIYALTGNRAALMEGKRFEVEDLNRMWTKEKIEELRNLAKHQLNKDQLEQLELLSTVEEIISRSEGPLYFFDLHTTSSETIPFTTVNDSLLNRQFAENIPVPMILGIEEYLEGPLLSYINDLGYVSFGFEGGQHQAESAINNHFTFALLSLHFANVLTLGKQELQERMSALQNNLAKTHRIYEIYYRHELAPSDQFEMKEGYQNFQEISKGQLLATVNGESLYADHNAQIFMPLYQSQGEDAFFAVRPIAKWILTLSAFLRKRRVDRILAYLPGVKWASMSKNTLMVNKSIARFFAKEIMHLMGYRSRYFDKEYLLMKNREANSKIALYQKEAWLTSKN